MDFSLLTSDPVAFLTSEKSIACVVTLVITGVIWTFVNNFAANYRKNAAEMDDPQNVHFFVSIIKGVIFAICTITILQICGINFGSLITGLGVAGIIVGFALQDSLKDVLMGAGIATNHFFNVGDVIRYRSADGKTIRGKVTGYDMRITKIYNIDNGGHMTISNRNLTEVEVLADWLDIDVPTKYDLDFHEGRALCEELTKRFREVPDAKDAQFLGTDKFADSSVIYRIRVFVDPEKDASVKRACYGIMQETFAERNVELPFNELVVHVQE